MKRWTVLASLATVVLAATGLILFAQNRGALPGDPEKEKRTIKASGTATIHVKADSARCYFGVQTLADNVKEARADNATRVKKVLDALHNLKIAGLKMKSSDMQVEAISFPAEKDQLPKIVGFRVTNSFTVLVEDDNPEKLSALASRIFDTAVENGANIVQHISFFRKDVEEARRQAKTKAVENAVLNARALAAGINRVLAETIEIVEEPAYHYYPGQLAQNVMAAPAAEGPETPLVVGEQVITCTVGITCRY